MFVADRVHFSRKGGFTCPVQTFMIFVSDEYIDLESELFSNYDNLLSEEDIDKLLETPAGSELKALETRDISGVLFREFVHSN